MSIPPSRPPKFIVCRCACACSHKAHKKTAYTRLQGCAQALIEGLTPQLSALFCTQLSCFTTGAGGCGTSTVRRSDGSLATQKGGPLGFIHGALVAEGLTCKRLTASSAKANP
eukprot:scaffold233146_cov15-Tisochrysis_lutea.AAC.1